MKIDYIKGSDILTVTGDSHLVNYAVGFWILAAGVLFFLMGAGVIPFEGEVNPAVLYAIGALLTLAGIVVMTVRSGIVIDKTRGTMLKWYGLFAPMIRSEKQLPADGMVTINKQVVKGKNSSTTYFPVKLSEKNNSNALEICSPTDYTESRKAAEQLAEFMRWSVGDTTSGTEVVREYDKLNESIRDLIERSGEKLSALPSAPAFIKCSIRETGDGIAIEIPPRGFTLIDYLKMSISIPIFIFLMIFFMTSSRGPESEGPPPIMMGVFIIFACGIPFLITLFKTLPKAKKKVVVSASPQILNIDENWMYLKKSNRLDVGRIEELNIVDKSFPIDLSALSEKMESNPETAPKSFSEDPQNILANPNAQKSIQFIAKLFPGPRIVARTDELTLEFGEGLSAEELKYIYAALKKAIAG